MIVSAWLGFGELRIARLAMRVGVVEGNKGLSMRLKSTHSARMQARAAIADGKGQFSLETIEVSEPIGDEVLVEIKAAGLCHTDHASLNWKRPLIMGHEGAGIVLSIGPLVRHVRRGDPVVLNWAIPCGTCFQC